MNRNDVRSEAVVVSGKGLGKTNCVLSESFEVIFVERKVECNCFQICFISEVVHRLLSSDNTVSKFEVLEHKFRDDVVEQFSKLFCTGCIEINERNCNELEILFRNLGNDELLNRIVDFEIGPGCVTVDNCLSRLAIRVRNKCNCEDELRFVSSHFWQLNSSHLERLKESKVDVLERIVSSENLCLRDEDSLVEFISSLGKECENLYNYVELQFLSFNGIQRFLQCFSPENINRCVWESICRRLQYKLLDCKLDSKRFIDQFRFPYIEGHEWNGILSDLTQKCNGNVHKKGIVTITSSGGEGNEPWDVVNYGCNDYWRSWNVRNSWICFDFKEKVVSLQHYTLKSWSNDHFIQWEIEGSNDEETWRSIDTRSTVDLCGKSIVKTYKCSKTTEFFRFIRMRQSGKNNHDSHHLALAGIEFFGSIKS
jgi:hypothetical protein